MKLGLLTMTGHHDDFFKETFSIKENVADFTFHVLPPEVRELLDLSSLHLENQSFLDDELSSHFSDLIYKCDLRGSKIKIALLFEHKSYVDPDLPFQLNKYMVNIWNYNKKQKEAFIPVIPIVLYHGKKNWNPGSFSDCFTDIPTEIKRFIPNFDYIFIDLSKYTDKEIKNEIFKNALLKIRLLILKNIFDEEKLQTQETLRAKTERDKELNRKKNEKAAEKAILAQIKQLIQSNNIDHTDGEIAYQFSDGKNIKKIYINELLQTQIINGLIAITKLEKSYLLVPRVIAEKISQRDAAFVIVLNRNEIEEIDENDPYADNKIPDDLMW